MIRDPLYRQIVAALNQPLNRELFEHCAVNLLRQVYPTLVPILGGGDSGMDGAIADPDSSPFPLVCTTGTDVIGNLTQSLSTYIRDGGTARRAVSVTSQSLTPRRRDHLFARAQELGFQLIQVHEQSDVADRLYRNPEWCRDLLGIAGNRPALSAVPLNMRPSLGDELVGREADISWLEEITEDRLLVGQPGIGKTALLRTLVSESNALFVVDRDIGRIHDVLRAEQPRLLIVDDAHLCSSFLSELRHLREHTGENFLIVAATWPGAETFTAEALNLPPSAIRSLDLLTRNQIVEVIRGTGLEGPRDLVRTIVNQAEGRPGLAVTLVHMCLRGDIRGVALGEALSRNTRTTIQSLVGPEASYLLAAFALGGEDGLTLESAAKAFGVSILDVSVHLSTLAAAGVVTEVRQFNDDRFTFVVRPPFLRYALVRDVFFNGAVRLPYQTVLNQMANLDEPALTLVLACAVGSTMDRRELKALLDRVKSVGAWESYAALGEPETTSLLNSHPQLALPIAEIALETAPLVALPLLFKEAIADSRPLAQNPDHPMRRIMDWIQRVIPNTGDGVHRRQVLVGSASNWLTKGGDAAVVAHAFSIALLPGFETFSPDPGSGMSITISRGLLSASEVRSILNLWPEILDFLQTIEQPTWGHFLHMTEAWIYYDRGSNTRFPEDLSEELRNGATRLLSDIAVAARSEPGVIYQIHQLVAQEDLDVDVTIDPVFELIYGEDLTENWVESEAKRDEKIRLLAAEWRNNSVTEVVKSITSIEESARSVTLLRHRRIGQLSAALASIVDQPTEWIEAILRCNAGYDLILPFLMKSVEAEAPGWNQLVLDCLESPNAQLAAIQVTLGHLSPPDTLITNVLNLAPNYATEIRTLCLRNQVSTANLKELITHPNEELAGMAATAHWFAEPKGSIQPELNGPWRHAILSYVSNEDFLDEILRSAPEIALDWLRWQVTRDPTPPLYLVRGTSKAAISAINAEARSSILSHIRDGFYDPDFIAQLVGNDPQVYETLFDIPHLRDCWFAPLGGALRPAWFQLAQVAIRRDLSPEQVASGSIFGLSTSMSGPQSVYWEAKRNEFSRLLEHQDEDIRRVGECGVAIAISYREAALSKERDEAIYG